MYKIILAICLFGLGACTSVPRENAPLEEVLNCDVLPKELWKKRPANIGDTKQISYTIESRGQMIRCHVLSYTTGSGEWRESMFIWRGRAPIWVGHAEDPVEQRIRQLYKGMSVKITDIVIQ